MPTFGQVELRFLQNVALAVTGGGLDAERHLGDPVFREVFEKFLSGFDPPLRVGFRLFLLAMEVSPLVVGFHLRPFSRLGRVEQVRYLGWLAARRLYTPRALVAMLKTLSMMAFCSIPNVQEALGYRPLCLKGEGVSTRNGGSP